MKKKITEYLLSIVLVTIVLFAGLLIFNSLRDRSEKLALNPIRPYLDINFFDYNSPFQYQLLSDLLTLYYPEKARENRKVVESLKKYHEDRFSTSLLTSHLKEKLDFTKVLQLFGMYIKFIFVYVLVMFLTCYGVQTIGVFLFIRKKEKGMALAVPVPRDFRFVAFKVLKSIGKAAGFCVLFSPAYVISYALRTEFRTDSLFFLVLLATVSNGLLINYANKFYAFLVSESRKGYVDTARVKNLSENYALNVPNGLALKTILRPVKRFKGHVFDHIYMNARFQYLATLKEQASFLITGLIIIEMALNLHGYLSYELLKQLLYKNYGIVAVIILGIFFTVKTTELFTDYLIFKETKSYENGPV